MRPPFLLVMALLLAMGAPDARGHDARHPELKAWFEGLRSDFGPCCSDADGNVLIDADWESKDGHYRVRIDGQWIDVPDKAVVNQPNLYGPTMVWTYLMSALGGPVTPVVRCFMPGSMG